jgi:hypothetical protein
VTASSDSGDGGWDVFAYTAQFGNGLSASLSAEVQRRTYIAYTGTGVAGTGYGTGATGLPVGAPFANYAGHSYPDLVANLRVDQAWGSAQVMGALHNVAATYYGALGGFAIGNDLLGSPGDEMGYAVAAGLKLNAPMIGPGDYFQIQAGYAKGATRYNNMTATVWDYRAYDGTTFGLGIQTDAVYGGSPAGGGPSALELTESWSVNAAYTHYWTPALKSTLWGSYFAIDYNNNANAMLCSAIGHGAGNGIFAVANAGCDMDWQAYGAGLRTEWAVTPDFSIGVEALYANLETAVTETGTIALGANGTKAAGTYVLTDQDMWAVRFRANRNFKP